MRSICSRHKHASGRKNSIEGKNYKQERKWHDMTEYIYAVVREYPDGSIAKRKNKIYRFEPDLRVGGLYVHLGAGFPGMQRILSVSERHLPD